MKVVHFTRLVIPVTAGKMNYYTNLCFTKVNPRTNQTHKPEEVTCPKCKRIVKAHDLKRPLV
jgi:hypothetical protein